jgi:putative drug exporter of the RND superfamily
VQPIAPSLSAMSTVDHVFEHLARFVVRFRFFIVAFWLLAAILLSSALPSLGSKVNNNNSAFLPASAPSSKATSLAQPLLGGSNRSQILIVASRAGARLTAADRAAIARELAAAQGVPNVVAAREVGVSADGQAAQIRVRVAASAQNLSVQKQVVGGLQSSFARAGAPSGLQMHLAGQIATAVASQNSTNRAGKQIQMFSILFIIVLLGFVFRAPLAALLTLAPSGLALLIAMRVIGGLGSAGLKISGFAQFLLIVLVLGAGTDYGLFLVFRFREELREGREPRDAVLRALARVGESISASAGTVIVALLTLLLASFGLYRDLGIPLAVGIAVMVLIGLTLLPALLAIFGRATFWPRRMAPVSGSAGDGLWSRVATRAIRRPARTLAVGVSLFLLLAAGALAYSSSGFGGSTSAPSGSDPAAGDAALASHFPRSSANPANLVFRYATPVSADPGEVARAEAALRASGAFTRLTGPLDCGEAAAADVSANGRTVQFEASLAAGPQTSTQAMNETPRIRAIVTHAAAASGAVDSGLAGQAAASYDISTTANNDLARIVPIAILAIGLLLALVLRSLIAPLYLIVSVALSYFAALGLATLAFVTIGGERGLVFILPFLMFVFLLALGEDYNILVMTRIREEAQERPLAEAVVKAIGRTGSTVTSAGLILGGTFAVLALAGSGAMGGQVRAMGFGLAAGILLDTFVVRTLLVPSTVVLLGRWNWWPSALGRAPGASEGGEARSLRPAPVRGGAS